MAEANLDSPVQDDEDSTANLQSLNSLDISFASLEPSSFFSPSVNGTPHSDAKTSTNGPVTPQDNVGTSSLGHNNISTTKNLMSTTDFPIPDTPAPLKAAINDMSKVMFDIDDLSKTDEVDDTNASIGPVRTVGGYSPRIPGNSSSSLMENSILSSYTPSASKLDTSFSSNRKGQSLTLKEQEKIINDVKKENFSLKLKIYHLEERLQLMAPDHIETALKENVELKVQFATLARQLKDYKRLLEKQDKVIEHLHAERARIKEGMTDEQKEEFTSAIRELHERRRQVEELEETLARKDEDFRIAQLAQTNAQSVAHEEEIERLKDELTDAMEDKRMLQEDQDMLKNEKQYFADQLEELRDEHDSLLKEMDEMRRELEMGKSKRERTDDNEDDDDEKEEYDDDISMDTPDNITISGHRRKAEKQRRQQLEEEAERHLTQIEELEADVFTLKTRINSQDEIIQMRDAEREKLYEELQIVKTELIELRDQEEEILPPRPPVPDQVLSELGKDAISTLRDKVSTLTLDLRKKESELEAAYRNITDNDILQQRVAELNQALKAKDKEIGMAYDKVEEYEELVHKVHALTRDLQERDTELDDIYAQMEEKEALYGEEIQELKLKLTDEVNRLQDENINLKEDIEVFQRDQEALIAKIEELQITQEEDNTATQDIIDQLEARIKEQQLFIDELKEYRTEMEDRIYQLSQELEQRIDIIQNLQQDLDHENQAADETETINQEVVKALKDKVALIKSRYSELSAQYENAMSEIDFLRTRNEEYAEVKSELAERLRRESETRDVLQKRLAEISTVSNTMEKKAKDLETKFSSQYADLRKQLDARLRQLEKFEGIVKNATLVQSTWRDKLLSRTSELEAAKEINEKLHKEIDGIKEKMELNPNSGIPSRAILRALETKATSSEKREKAAIRRFEDAEKRWTMRLKELETRLRAAEERVKRERQGAKERVADLESNIRQLEKQLDGARRRNNEIKVYKRPEGG